MTQTWMDDHPLLAAPAEVPPELAARAAERGWDDGLLRRAIELRVPRADLEFWLTVPHITAKEVAYNLDTLSRTFCGPLRNREATWRDGEALADLYANAPEDVGEWRLTVERGPNPYAQFRLQEHVNIQVVECKGVLLAATAHSGRNTMIAGERASTHFMSAWRVRGEFRGMGLSRILQMTPGPASAWFGMITYWYERSDNASQGWLDKMSAMAETRGNTVGALTSTVHMFEPSGAETGEPAPGLRIRPVEPADIGRCVELINSTHTGLDLFRPYTAEFLEMHLDDPFWGPKPPFWARVFTWDDYAVVEDGGEVVACGGLWDKGRDVREVWEHKESGDRRVLEPTALLDWGHAPGREDAMAALVRRFLAQTAELGRTHLLAPLDQAAGVLAHLDDLPHRTETRALKCMGFASPEVTVEAHITRPYTDLAYW